jgi:hypothetical protein
LDGKRIETNYVSSAEVQRRGIGFAQGKADAQITQGQEICPENGMTISTEG